MAFYFDSHPVHAKQTLLTPSVSIIWALLADWNIVSGIKGTNKVFSLLINVDVRSFWLF